LLPDPLPSVYPHRSTWLNGNGSHQDYFPFLAGLEIPPAWEAAADRFGHEGGPALPGRRPKLQKKLNVLKGMGV
jgi:hypothetical protein